MPKAGIHGTCSTNWNSADAPLNRAHSTQRQREGDERDDEAEALDGPCTLLVAVRDEQDKKAADERHGDQTLRRGGISC